MNSVQHLSGRGRRPWQRRNFAESLIAVNVAIELGAAAVLIEQFMIRTTTASEDYDDMPLLLFAAAVVVIAGVLMWPLFRWRSAQKRTRGTVYYVRALAPWMSDWHGGQAAQRVADGDHFDFRTIQRVIPLVAEDETYDLVNAVDEITRDLEMTMNDDPFDTTYHLIPNLLWPLAAGLGARLNMWPSMVLEEVDVERPDSAHPESRGRTAWTPRSDRTLNHAHLSPFIESKPADPDGAPMTVLMGLDLSEKPHALSLGSLRPAHFVDVQGATWDPIAKAATPTRQPHVSTAKNTPLSQRMDPRYLSHEVACALRETIHAHHGHRVYVAAMMSKTIAVALGWLAANPETLRLRVSSDILMCKDPGCRDPWSVLVPMNYGEADFTPVRVLHNQPSRATMQTDLAAMRLAAKAARTSDVAKETREPTPRGGVHEIINLTAHDVIVLGDSSAEPRGAWQRVRARLGFAKRPKLAVWKPSGQVARLVERQTPENPLALGQVKVPTQRLTYSDEVRDLPPAESGRAFIVSRVLAAHVVRDDLYFPAGEVRGRGGRIVGCSALGQFRGEARHA